MKKEKKEKNESIIIALLVLIIIILLVLVGLLSTGAISYKPKEVPKEEINVKVTPKEETKSNIFEDFAGTYTHTNNSEACGEFKLTLELTTDGKATLDIKDECSGDKNGSGIYTIGADQIYITYDKTLQGETEVDYTKFAYSYDNSKPIIYSDNEKLIKQ